MLQTRIAAALMLAAVAVAWGAIPLIVRGDVPWQHLVASRIWLGAITLIVILLLRGRRRFPRRHRVRIAVSGVLLAVHWASFFLAVTETTVAVALAILYLGPIVASALAPKLLGERVRPRVYAGLGIALAGVLMVVRPEAPASVTGLVAAVVSGATLAALMLIAKPAAESVGALVVATGELTIAALVLTPWAVEAAIESSDYWLQMLVLGVLLTGIADLIYWGAMQRLPVAGVSVLMYLEPASAVVWAAVFLAEPAGLIAWIGIALVLIGGVLSATSTTRAEEAVGIPAAL
jgi:drug/metabolite transporter (DMT)-like permease